MDVDRIEMWEAILEREDEQAIDIDTFLAWHERRGQMIAEAAQYDEAERRGVFTEDHHKSVPF